MPASQTCLSSRAALQEIGELREKFTKGYGELSLDSPEFVRLELKILHDALKNKMEELDRGFREAWSFESEKLFDLKKQYDAQVKLLINAGMVKAKPISEGSNEEARFFITGVDGCEYFIPSFAMVKRLTYERRNVLRIKADQQFRKFLLVPFAMSMEEMLHLFKIHLYRHKIRHEGFGLSYDPISLTSSTETRPSFLDEDFVYGPKMQTKKEVLQVPSDAGMVVHDGWQMLFLQTYDDQKTIEGVHAKKRFRGAWNRSGTKLPRYTIDHGMSPEDYARFLQQAVLADSPYQGESGMTIESWITACIYTLNHTGKMLDSVYFSEGRGNFCIDSRTINTGHISSYRIQWASHDEALQVEIVREPMGKAHATTGLRTEVRV